MKASGLPQRPVREIIWCVIAFVPLIIANVIQWLSLALLPFSYRFFHRANMAIADAVWSWWSVIIERLQGTKIVIEGDELRPGESGVVIANHQAMGDIVVMLCFARRTGRMTEMRWMVKASMRFVPILGWSMLFLDFLFLKRDWSKDRARILGTFERFRKRPEPVLLVLFPEGTRQTPAKYAASMEHARRVGAVETSNVMLPRVKGFVASVQGLEDKLDAVYRLTISYPRGVPTLMQLFAGATPEIRIACKRFPMSEFPQGEAARGQWLQQEFVAMDDWLSRSLQRGPTPGAEPVSSRSACHSDHTQTPPRHPLPSHS